MTDDAHYCPVIREKNDKTGQVRGRCVPCDWRTKGYDPEPDNSCPIVDDAILQHAADVHGLPVLLLRP